MLLSQTRVALCVVLTFISCQDLTGPCKQPNLINRSANEQSSGSKDISNLVIRFVYKLISQVTYAVRKKGERIEGLREEGKRNADYDLSDLTGPASG